LKYKYRFNMMRSIILFQSALIICVFVSPVMSQTISLPIHYQAVLRDSAGRVLSNRTVAMKLEVTDSTGSTVYYGEIQTITSNAFGQINVRLGNGNTVIGNYSALSWHPADKYLRTAIDFSGGNNFLISGSAPFLSVPYSNVSYRVFHPGIRNNTAFGNNALSVLKSGYLDSGGSGNTAIGVNSLAANQNGHSNSALGTNALAKLTTGSNNTAIGFGSLSSITTNSGMTAVGYNSMASNTTGFNNVAIGSSALQNNTTGFYITAIGTNALISNTVGNDNEAVGMNAMRDNISGGANTAVGGNALLKNKTGSFNVSVGHATGEQNESGNNNTILGSYAAQKMNSANGNTVVGSSAIAEWSAGSGNVIIGSQVGNHPSLLNQNNSLIIANSSTSYPLLLGRFDSARLYVQGDLIVRGKTTINQTRIIKYGTNVSTETPTLDDNVDVYYSADGLWNPMVYLPVPVPSNQNLINRVGTTLLVTCKSSFSFKVNKNNTDLLSDLILATNEFVLFMYDGSMWRKIAGKL